MFSLYSLLLLPFILMYFYVMKKHRNILSIYVLTIAIILPKISIINVNFVYGTGIRIEDIILVMFGITLIFEKLESIKSFFKTRLFIIFIVYVIVITASLFSGFYIGGIYSKSSAFFRYLRNIEYFCYLFVGIDFYSKNKDKFYTYIKYFLYITLIVNLFVAISQKYEMMGSFRLGGFSYIDVSVGLFNGPYEIGAFCNIIIAFFMIEILKKDDFLVENVFVVLASLILILLSKSRLSLLCALFIIILQLFINLKGKQKLIILSIGLILLVGFIFMIDKISILSRFRTINLNDLIYSIKYYAKNANYENFINMPTDKTLEHYVIQRGDVSFNCRMFKWFSFIDLFKKYPIFGYGYNSSGIMDGNYIKLLVETGIIGLIVFILLLVSIVFYNRDTKFKLNKYLVFIFIIMILNATLIDIFESSKIMQIFYFVAGVCVSNKLNNKKGENL